MIFSSLPSETNSRRRGCLFSREYVTKSAFVFRKSHRSTNVCEVGLHSVLKPLVNFWILEVVPFVHGSDTL